MRMAGVRLARQAVAAVCARQGTAGRCARLISTSVASQHTIAIPTRIAVIRLVVSVVRARLGTLEMAWRARRAARTSMQMKLD